MIGQLVGGRYEIVQLLGEGGMGAVFEARDTEDGRSVAVKLITDEEVAQNEVLVARFEREARAAARVVSPHIVEILDAGHEEPSGMPFMVMELLHGDSVLAVLERLGPLPPDLAIRIGIQTCRGLTDAHAVGVVHRDVKPANLFLVEGENDELTVKLLDFGVAKFKMDKASESDSQSLTRTGSMLGSPIYMAPEQARGLKSIDHRADIWSLGIVMHQLLTGRKPYEGIEGLGELIITICSEPPERVTTHAPWCSPELAAVVARALQLSPDARHASAEAMRQALARCLGDGADAGMLSSMLVPLDESLRAMTGAQDEATVALAEIDREEPSPISQSDIAKTVALDRERPAAPAFAGLDEAARARQMAAQQAAMDAARLSSRSPTSKPTTMAIVAGVVVGAVGLLLFLGLGSSPGRERSSTPATSALEPSAAEAVSAAPSQARAPEPSPPPVPSAAPAADRLRVKVSPPDVGVTVAGKRAAIEDGYVAVDAELGQTVIVALTREGKTKTVAVKITESGPDPADIAFEP